MKLEANNNMEMDTRRIGWVYEALPLGQENAVPGHELAKALGISDLRKLTQLIERERRAGFPVCATQGGSGMGYYKPRSPEQLNDYIKRLSGRAANYRRTIERMNNTLAEWCGQTLLFNEGSPFEETEA